MHSHSLQLGYPLDPSGNWNSYWKRPIGIVDFPIKYGDFPWFSTSQTVTVVYQRVSRSARQHVRTGITLINNLATGLWDHEFLGEIQVSNKKNSGNKHGPLFRGSWHIMAHTMTLAACAAQTKKPNMTQNSAFADTGWSASSWCGHVLQRTKRGGPRWQGDKISSIKVDIPKKHLATVQKPMMIVPAVATKAFSYISCLNRWTSSSKSKSVLPSRKLT